MMFGKSLNMTPMSILAALVIWGSVWGIIGAILSVPMLTIQKILLTKANHPLAKHALGMIREDASIDENDPDGAEAKKLKQDTNDGPMPNVGKSASKMTSREVDHMDNPLQGGSQPVVASLESSPPDVDDDADDV
jgi:hypothetical protein